MTDEMKRAAYHEAGHAVMAVLRGGVIRSVRLDEQGGVAQVAGPGDEIGWADEDDAVLVDVAGPVAEAIMQGETLKLCPVCGQDTTPGWAAANDWDEEGDFFDDENEDLTSIGGPRRDWNKARLNLHERAEMVPLHAVKGYPAMLDARLRCFVGLAASMLEGEWNAVSSLADRLLEARNLAAGVTGADPNEIVRAALADAGDDEGGD